MRVLMVEPMEKPYITNIGSDLASLQAAVGGLIQEVCPWTDPVVLICNDEGKINRMTPNRILYSEDGIPYDVIMGPFLLCGVDDEVGDFADLPESLIQKYMSLFEIPEIIF